MQVLICTRRRLALMRGFTLVEMMMTVAIAAIMMSVAVPSFQEMVQRNRVASATNQLLGALRLARSEAVTRGKTVTCQAAGTGWGDGWVIFVDENEDGALGSSEPMIKIRQLNGEQSDVSVVGNSAVASAISFASTGKKVGNQGGTITVSDGPHITTITVNRVGRVHSERDD